eukprot:gb/GEZN01003147.1/.p1 GENE.gb/GEZN01003147.1/~~gb/GEZN01003147.1/.p1  ORF type:complete len:594 (+),score=55.44 gb/GEZN01003147.1/:120-1784(+)
MSRRSKIYQYFEDGRVFKAMPASRKWLSLAKELGFVLISVPGVQLLKLSDDGKGPVAVASQGGQSEAAVATAQTEVDVSLPSCLINLLDRRALADVVFVMGTERVFAHRLILAAQSVVFEAMLYPKNASTGSVYAGLVKGPLEVNLEGVEAKHFKALLRLLYDSDEPTPLEESPGILQLANKYHLEQVKMRCLAFLKEHITKDNCLQLFAQGVPYSLSVCARYAHGILSSAAFLELSEDLLKPLISSDFLAVDELTIFRSVLRWGRYQITKRDRERKHRLPSTSLPPVSKQELKTVVAELLPHVRFPLLSLQDLAGHVVVEELLDLETLTQLYSYLSLPYGTQQRQSKAKTLPFSCVPRRPLSTISVPPKNETPFIEADGCFHAIGTHQGKRPWTNPATSGDITILQFPGSTWTQPSDVIVDDIASSREFKTDVSVSSNFFGVDLRDYRIAPTHYLYKNGGGRGLVVKSWVFESKIDDSSPWVPLDIRSNVNVYSSNSTGFNAHVWGIPKLKDGTAEPTTFYKQFRFLRSDSKNTTYVHRFEVYGTLKKAKITD